MSSTQPPTTAFDPRTASIRRADPDTYPAYARLLADSFSGKFAIALGRAVEARTRRMLTLLPSGILCPGTLYGVWQADALLATFTLCLTDNGPRPEDYTAARAALAAQEDPLRATWAVNVLRVLGSPHVQPGEVYLDNLAVARDRQHQGVASYLAGFVYEESRSLGATTIVADVMSSNYRVRGLIQNEGWEIVSRNYWVAPVTWPLFRTAGIFRVRKQLDPA